MAAHEPTTRYEIHMGLWSGDDFVGYDCENVGSGIFKFHTDDQEQAERAFACIERYMEKGDTLLGMYLHERNVRIVREHDLRYFGRYDPSWEDEDAVHMRWYLEDYADDWFDMFDLTIYGEE